MRELRGLEELRPLELGPALGSGTGYLSSLFVRPQVQAVCLCGNVRRSKEPLVSNPLFKVSLLPPGAHLLISLLKEIGYIPRVNS